MEKGLAIFLSLLGGEIDVYSARLRIRVKAFKFLKKLAFNFFSFCFKTCIFKVHLLRVFSLRASFTVKKGTLNTQRSQSFGSDSNLKLWFDF